MTFVFVRSLSELCCDAPFCTRSSDALGGYGTSYERQFLADMC